MTHTALLQALPAARIALALLLVSAAAGAAAGDWGPRAEQKLLVELANSDCTAAVKTINGGMADGAPKAYLLAGSMYEDGACVRRDWKRAMELYVRAHDGGRPEAAFRLASGFAAPENGPDIAAALWWAGKAWSKPIGGCGVSAAAAADPDLFVAELRGWPQPRLAQCNYVVGVMSMIAGDVQYPPRATPYGVDQEVMIRFVPAVPRVELKLGRGGQYQVLGTPNRDRLVTERNAHLVAAEFRNVVNDVSERALKRYLQPPGIDPGVAFPLLLQFEMVK